jgi:ribose 5-phosphate isomerase A
MATDTESPAVRAKRHAAEAALAQVEDGMLLGLGSGSTAELFIAALGRRMAAGGLRVKGVPTSEASARAAKAAGVPLVAIDDVTRLDLDIDGTDEIDPAFNLIKGGGGCLLREKIVAAASDRMVVIADASKRVETLGGFPLPVEVDRFGAALTARKIADALIDAGAAKHEPKLRRGKEGAPFVTDGGHHIYDCATARLPDPARAARALAEIPGVVEHGLFLGLASLLIVGGPDGAELVPADARARRA